MVQAWFTLPPPMTTVILRVITQRYLAARQLCTPHICKWQRGDCFSKYYTKWAIKSSEVLICSRKCLVSGLSFDAQVQSDRWFWNQNYKNTLGALSCFQCSLKSWAVFWLFDGTVELVTAERSFHVNKACFVVVTSSSAWTVMLTFTKPFSSRMWCGRQSFS